MKLVQYNENMSPNTRRNATTTVTTYTVIRSCSLRAKRCRAEMPVLHCPPRTLRVQTKKSRLNKKRQTQRKAQENKNHASGTCKHKSQEHSTATANRHKTDLDLCCRTCQLSYSTGAPSLCINKPCSCNFEQVQRRCYNPEHMQRTVYNCFGSRAVYALACVAKRDVDCAPLCVSSTSIP